LKNIEKIFTEAGGTFLVSSEEFSEKLKNIKAFIFDWDGVFNNGEKNETGSSNFSEVDSMGVNMLRLSFWLGHKQLPLVAVISGEHNHALFALTNREHYDAAYYKIGHKAEALEHFCRLHGLKNEEVAFVFDDVLDLSIAAKCGLRVLVNRKSNPLFKEYIKTNHLADYITASFSGEFAVREYCELLLGINRKYDDTINARISNAADYRDYLDARNRIVPAFFTKADDVIVARVPGN